MNEIQDCIADAQFSEVLRARDTTHPNKPIPLPPKDFDCAEFAKMYQMNMASCTTQPLGVYILSRFSPSNKGVYNFLYELHGFRMCDNPDLRAYRALLEKAQEIPPDYKSLVNQLSLYMTRNVLPSLRGTPSTGRILDTERDLDLESIDVVVDSTVDEIAEGEEISEDEIGEKETGMQEDKSDKADSDNVLSEEAEKLAEKEIEKRRRSLVWHREENKRTMMVHFDELKKTLLFDQQNLWKEFVKCDQFERLMGLLWYAEQPVTIASFNIFRDLGRGAFGVVSGAKFRTTGALLALKCMNRKLVKGKNALKLVRAEREVLAKLGEYPCNFTVFLKYSWHDINAFYLALPLCTGGDLNYHLQEQRSFPPKLAQFYTAQIVLGLAHLHNQGILHRDLKPENILLDEEGYCRISDMGLAVITNGKMVHGRAGTPGYWSPEMISKKCYSYPTDWWSMGCVTYELITGRCPFSKLNTKMERDNATLTWKLEFPEKLSDENVPFPEPAKAFISKLLLRDKTKRLGSSERGAEDVKDDIYFEGVDWSKLNRKEISPPWKPHKEVIHAFNQSDIDSKSNDHDYRKLKLEPEDDIADFSYVAKNACQEDLVYALKLTDEGEIRLLGSADSDTCCIVL